MLAERSCGRAVGKGPFTYGYRIHASAKGMPKAVVTRRRLTQRSTTSVCAYCLEPFTGKHPLRTWCVWCRLGFHKECLYTFACEDCGRWSEL